MQDLKYLGKSALQMVYEKCMQQLELKDTHCVSVSNSECKQKLSLQENSTGHL